MIVSETILAKKEFVTKMVLSDGGAFEQLFTTLMQQVYPDFVQVKPQGSIGDRSCDGYSKSEELFCQVYAPEDLSKNEDACIDKLMHDFEGLMAYWPKHGFSVKNFRYVVNDKTKGAYPTLLSHINQIQLQHPELNVELWMLSHLEHMFVELTDEQRYLVLDYVPIPSAVYCEHSALSDVVKHLATIQIKPTFSTIPLKLDTQKKIQFNGLSDEVKRFLEDSIMHSGHVEDFFCDNNFEHRELLREKFSGLYQEMIGRAESEGLSDDDVFREIYVKACPNNMTKIQDTAVRALMAYYFESCDIFKVPKL